MRAKLITWSLLYFSVVSYYSTPIGQQTLIYIVRISFTEIKTCFLRRYKQQRCCGPKPVEL